MGKREIFLLLGVLALSLLVRVYTPSQHTFIGWDGAIYARLGKNIVENGKYSFGEDFNQGTLYPPGYPAAIGLADLLFDNLLLSGRIVSIMASLVTVVLFYLIGRELHNEESGLFAAFAYGVYPFFSRYITCGVTSEPLMNMLVFSTIYVFIKTLRGHGLMLLAPMGFLMASAYLTRPEGLVLLLLPLLLADAKSPGGRGVLRIACIYLVFIMLSAPYLIFLKDTLGHYTASGKYRQNLMMSVIGEDHEYKASAFALNADKTGLVVRDPSIPFSVVGYIREHPGAFNRSLEVNFFKLIAATALLTIPILLPLLLSLSSDEFYGMDRRILTALVVTPAMMFAVYLVAISPLQTRFLYAIVSFLILTSSVGYSSSVETTAKICGRLRIRGRYTSIVQRNIKLTILLTILLGQAASYIRNPPNAPSGYTTDEYAGVGFFIKNSTNASYEELNVMSFRPYIPFYSGSRWTELPYAGGRDVIKFGGLYKVDYVVIDDSYGFSEHYGELTSLENISKDVEKVYEDKEAQIRIYRLNRE